MTLSRDSAVRFISRILIDAASAGLNLDSNVIDHVCYRTRSLDEYHKLKQALLENRIDDLEANLLTESPVNGRPIATFRLQNPILVNGFSIEAIELPAPKSGAIYETGFEHVEAVITQSFVEFQSNYPRLNFDVSNAEKSFNSDISIMLSGGKIKFHHLPLSGVIALESLAESGVLGLSGKASLFLPTLVGSRLKLRPLRLDDYDALYQVARDPQLWVQHSEPERYTPDAFKIFFDKALKGGGALVVELLSSKSIIGSTRFYDYRPRDRSIYAGYTFLGQDYWGGLFNRELKALIFDYAFCFVDKVFFQTSEENKRSRASLERLGAIPKAGVSDVPGIGLRVEYFMTKHRWQELKQKAEH